MNLSAGMHVKITIKQEILYNKPGKVKINKTKTNTHKQYCPKQFLYGCFCTSILHKNCNYRP